MRKDTLVGILSGPSWRAHGPEVGGARPSAYRGGYSGVDRQSVGESSALNGGPGDPRTVRTDQLVGGTGDQASAFGTDRVPGQSPRRHLDARLAAKVPRPIGERRPATLLGRARSFTAVCCRGGARPGCSPRPTDTGLTCLGRTAQPGGVEAWLVGREGHRGVPAAREAFLFDGGGRAAGGVPVAGRCGGWWDQASADAGRESQAP
jgi:hypothetical protein